MGSASVFYCTMYDDFVGHIDKFEAFVHEYLDDEKEVEDLCMKCDLTKRQWECVQRYCVMPQSVLKAKRNKICWDKLMMEYEGFTDEFVYEMGDYLDFHTVVLFSDKVSEECLRHFADRLPWQTLSEHRVMSFEFMDEFKDRMYWDDVTALWINKDRISEEFLERYSDYVNFLFMSKYCACLSTDMLEKFKDKLDWDTLTLYRKWTLDEAKRFYDRINWSRVERNEGNFHYSLSKMRNMRQKAWKAIEKDERIREKA